MDGKLIPRSFEKVLYFDTISLYLFKLRIMEIIGCFSVDIV